MSTVSVIYFTGSGHTAKLAEAVNQGAAAVAGVTTHLIAIKGEDITHGRYKNDEVMATLDASDAIIFGSPTYMGGPAAQFKALADATRRALVSRCLAQQGRRGFLGLQRAQRGQIEHAALFLHAGDAARDDLGGVAGQSHE